MRYAVLFVLVLAVCCAGCMYSSRHLRGVFPRPYRKVEAPRPDDGAHRLAQAPDIKSPADDPGLVKPDELPPLEHPPITPDVEDPKPRPVIKQTRRILVKKPQRELLSRRICVGLSLGSAYGNRDEAIDDMRQTEFGIGTLAGAHITYFPPMWKTSALDRFITRCALEFRVNDYTTMLSNDGLDIGKLHITSGVFAFKLYQMPKEGDVFGFHFHAGLGWGTTFFRKSGMMRRDDADNGRYTKIVSDTATIFIIGAGLDFHVAPNTVVSLDVTHVDATVPVKWSEDGVRRRDILRLDPNTTQIAISFNYFF